MFCRKEGGFEVQPLQCRGVGVAAGMDTASSFSPSPPVILSAPQIPVGSTNFIFQLFGKAGSNLVLQASADLSKWNPVITSAIPVSGSINLTNGIGGYNDRYYYRIHLQQIVFSVQTNQIQNHKHN